MPIKPINLNSKLVVAVSSNRLAENRVHVRKTLKREKRAKRKIDSGTGELRDSRLRLSFQKTL